MDRLICPSCGTTTSFNPVWVTVQGILEEQRREDSITYGEVSVKLIGPYRYDEANYAILECQACGKHLVVEKGEYAQEGEWQVVYPISHAPVAEEIPEPIKGEFEEASLCFAVGAYRGCLLVCRTVLIALQREQGVSNLKELKDKGTISGTLYEQSNQVRLWGNMVGHEDVLPEAITKEDSEQLLTYLGTLLDAVYIQPTRLAALTQKLEQLKKDTKPKPSSP